MHNTNVDCHKIEYARFEFKNYANACKALKYIRLCYILFSFERQSVSQSIYNEQSAFGRIEGWKDKVLQSYESDESDSLIQFRNDMVNILLVPWYSFKVACTYTLCEYHETLHIKYGNFKGLITI